MLRRLALIALLGPFATPCLAQCVVAEDASYSTPAQSGDTFGSSVVGVGDFAYVGAPQRSISGAVYVMGRAALDWKQLAQIPTPAPDSNGRFGARIAVAGPWMAISQPAKDGAGFDEGRVHLYQGGGASWAWHSTLSGSSVTALQNFGESLALQGDTLVVGAPRQGPGKAFVFEWNASAWVETAVLAPADLQTDDRFGQSCSLDGNWLAISAPSHGAAGTSVGAVYIYRRIGGVFQEQVKLLPGDATPLQLFGNAVALSGSSLIVTSPSFNGVGTSGGKAYVFTRVSGFWVEEAHLLGTGQSASSFGSSVAFDGTRALVGASGKSYARLFTRTGTAWNQSAHLVSQLGVNAQLGLSVSLDGSTLFVGAPTGGAPLTSAGNLQTWRDQPVSGTYCTAKVNSAGCTPQISIVGNASVSSPAPCTIHASGILDNKLGLLVYGTGGPQATPFLGGWLCINLPLKRTGVTNSGGSGPCDGTFTFDLAARIASGVDPALGSGGRIWAQFWSRDPGFAPPNNSNLTNAIYATICP